MKSLRWALLAALIINVLGVLGFIGWLGMTGRLNWQRLEKVVEVFKPTIAQELEEQKKADELAVQAQQKAAELARLNSVSEGPVTVKDRLDRSQQEEEMLVQRAERMAQDIESLKANLEQAKQLLAQERQAMTAQQAEFEQRLKAQRELSQREDFKQAVAMLEQQKPKTAKDWMMQLLQQGKQTDVVNYLAAMQLRKAGKVLAEFKSAEETQQATQLVQALRDRGIQLADQAMVTEANP